MPSPRASPGGRGREREETIPRTPRAQRTALRRRLREIEDELARAQAEYCALAVGEPLPGLHLVIGAAGYRALLPAAPVHEIVRLVALDPLPDAAPHVAGAFVFRGRPVLALDMASALGVSREPPLDAQILILQGAPHVGLVVDRVEALVESPLLVDEQGVEDGGNGEAWRRSGLTVGLCRIDAGLFPLLGIGPCLRAVGGVG